MAGHRAVYVELATGKPRRQWCDRCLTSARLVWDLYRLVDDGPHRMGTFACCTRCDPHLFR